MKILKFEMIMGNPYPKKKKKVVAYHAFDLYGFTWAVHRKNGVKHSKIWEISEISCGCGLILPKDCNSPLEAIAAAKEKLMSVDPQTVVYHYNEVRAKIANMKSV